MKKTIISLMLLALSMTFGVAFSQEEVSLKPIPAGYMPEKGDIALGISATPILNYVGNMFNDTQNNSLSNFGGQALGGSFVDMVAAAYDAETGTSLGTIFTKPFVSIMGKYMLKENMAVTANIGLISLGLNNRQYVQDDAAVLLDPLSEKQVVDALDFSAKGGSVALGAQWFRTHRKIQAYAGASLMYGFAGAKTKYTYGNEITEVNQTPTTYFSGYSTEGYIPNARILEEGFYGVGSVTALGAIGSVGLEWFFAPKISLGGEVTFSMIYAWQSQVSETYEGYSPQTLKVENYTRVVSPGMNGFLIGTENLGGNIFLNFYF